MLEWHPTATKETFKLSILIPTWNNLEMLKLNVGSIRKNSHFHNQIIIHLNEANEGSLEWVKSQGIDYTYSKKNIGVCWALNAARALVRTDYIVYLNDDMYLLPDWDLELVKEIEGLPDKFFFLSSTSIEPRIMPDNSLMTPFYYGNTIEDFREDDLLKDFKNILGSDWSGSTWPPCIVHKDIWDLVGGYSVEFYPGLYSDPDFSMKLYQAGVRVFKGVNKSRVYHFGSKSTLRIKMNKGSKQFLNKWGITSSTFSKYYIKRGQPYQGEVKVNHKSRGLKFSKIRSNLKRIFWGISGSGRIDGSIPI
jgi:GT2 family glycosyltransferase